MSRDNFTLVMVPDDASVEPGLQQVYSFLRNQFYANIAYAIRHFEQNEVVGVSTEQAAHELREEWKRVGMALDVFATYCEKFWEGLSAGPGINTLCVKCQERVPHHEGADLCQECLVEILTK